MMTLAEYNSFVTDMEKGEIPPAFQDGLAPIEDLIEAIRVEPGPIAMNAMKLRCLSTDWQC